MAKRYFKAPLPVGFIADAAQNCFAGLPKFRHGKWHIPFNDDEWILMKLKHF